MIVHAYYPLGEPRVEREARAAKEAGYSVDVVALRQPGEAARETVDGISVWRLPLRHVRAAGAARLLYEYGAFTLLASIAVARSHWRTPIAVCHVHAPPDFLLLAGAVPRLLGARLVLDIHDLSPHMYGARYAGLTERFASRILTGIERAACRSADGVLTVHEPYRRELIADGVSPAKVYVVMNAVDEAVIERVQTSAATPADGTFTVAYHGTINPWYGVDLIVEALARVRDKIPDARALVLGDGDALPSVRALSESMGVGDCIEFSGQYLPLADALGAVAGANCGVIPNRPSTLNRFALSSKLFEYVALSIPVVVSRLETLADHFAEDEVTFFEPGDADALAAAVLWVAQHPREACSKARRARERASAYSWQQNRERYLRMLHHLQAPLPGS